MTHQERRQYARKTLNPLPYIHLPSGNGGLVLDISEQGLRFRATAPMEQKGPINFSFTVHSNVVAGIGELVWFDQAKRTGGLRYTQLPYNALEQIRKWPQNSNLRPDITQDLTLHIPAQGEFEYPATHRRVARATGKSKAASEFDRLLMKSLRSMRRETWRPALRNAWAKLRAFSPAGYFQEQRPWLVKTTCAVGLGIVISTVVYVHHRGAGELLVRLGTRLSGGITTAAPAPAVASEEASLDDGSDYKAPAYQSVPDVPVTQAAPPSASPVAGKTAEEIPASAPVAQAPETAVRVAKPEVARTKLVVQVAALRAEGDARELTNRLRQENFQAFVGTLPEDSFYRVMLGPYPDAASARAVLGKLKRAGFDSFIRREPVAERLGS
jgi:sporulation related protein/PilZ domain-containing protein